MIILPFSRVGEAKDAAAVIERLCSSKSKTAGRSANGKPCNCPQKMFSVSVIQNGTCE